MKSKTLRVFLLVSLWPMLVTSAQSVADDQDDLTLETQFELISNVLAQFPEHSEMAVAIVRDDQVDFIGMKRAQGINETVDNSGSVFEIGSLTKIFTAHLMVSAFRDEVIGLDELVATYAPYEIQSNPPITFKHLGNHTSGLPGDIHGSIFNTKRSNPYKNWTNEKLTKFLATEVETETTPGTKYRYSNIGSAVLANTICHVRGQSYEFLLQSEIFTPLDMANSSTKRNKLNALRVQGYNWKGKPTENWDLGALEGAWCDMVLGRGPFEIFEVVIFCIAR